MKELGYKEMMDKIVPCFSRSNTSELRLTSKEKLHHGLGLRFQEKGMIEDRLDGYLF